jgi:hypothetical protein
MNDLFGFIYLSIFIYFFPITLIICIYMMILKHTRRTVIPSGIGQYRVDQRRQREFRFVQRILILVITLLITSLPYVTFFLVLNTSHSTLPSYAHRLSFMFLSFGQGVVMLLNLMYTDDVKKTLLNSLTKMFACIRNRQIENTANVNIPLEVYPTAAIQ